MIRILFVVIVIQITGCSTSPLNPTDEKQQVNSKQHYKRYVEAVFRRQNHAMSQMILLPIDELSGEMQLKLLNAEHSLTQRCKVLNDIASLRSEGKKESMLQKFKVSRSIKDCEAATHELEAVLEQARTELLTPGQVMKRSRNNYDN